MIVARADAIEIYVCVYSTHHLPVQRRAARLDLLLRDGLRQGLGQARRRRLRVGGLGVVVRVELGLDGCRIGGLGVGGIGGLEADGCQMVDGCD